MVLWAPSGRPGADEPLSKGHFRPCLGDPHSLSVLLDLLRLAQR